ncbi:MAG: hypothetical protein RIR45_1264, partial [Pseudomonadota bacterium]
MSAKPLCSSVAPITLKTPEHRCTTVKKFAIFLIATCAYSTAASATFDGIKAEFKASDVLVLDRHGVLLQRQRTDATV